MRYIKRHTLRRTIAWPPNILVANWTLSVLVALELSMSKNQGPLHPSMTYTQYTHYGRFHAHGFVLTPGQEPLDLINRWQVFSWPHESFFNSSFGLLACSPLTLTVCHNDTECATCLNYSFPPPPPPGSHRGAKTCLPENFFEILGQKWNWKIGTVLDRDIYGKERWSYIEQE